MTWDIPTWAATGERLTHPTWTVLRPTDCVSPNSTTRAVAGPLVHPFLPATMLSRFAGISYPVLKEGAEEACDPRWAPLVTEYLKQDGYQNYHSGKWHIDGKVLENGFTESWRVNNQGEFLFSKGNLVNDIPFQPNQEPENYYSTTATANHAVKCLREHARIMEINPSFII